MESTQRINKFAAGAIVFALNAQIGYASQELLTRQLLLDGSELYDNFFGEGFMPTRNLQADDNDLPWWA